MGEVWGIKGMKWGQRRYQNKDGSLTPAGKKRYNDEMTALKEREKTIKNRERAKAKQAKLAAKKAELDEREKALDGENSSKKGKFKGKNKVENGTEKPKQKSIKDMTDEELNYAIQRARMEDAYRQLRPEPVAKPKLSERLMKEVITPALMTSGKKALESMMDKAVKSALKDKVDPNSLEAIEAANKKLRARIENTLLKQGIDPNIKGENLDKWKKFNESLKKNDQVDKADTKGASDRTEAATDTAAATDKGRRQQQNRDAMNRAAQNASKRPGRVDQDSFDFDYEPPKTEYKTTVEGKGTSRRKNTTTERRKPDPIIIDADDTPVSNLPAVYTNYGRNYVNTLLLPAPRREDDD